MIEPLVQSLVTNSLAVLLFLIEKPLTTTLKYGDEAFFNICHGNQKRNQF
jgi:hypothetical protein